MITAAATTTRLAWVNPSPRHRRGARARGPPAASVALDQPPQLRRRYLSLMLDALNPADAQPLPPLPGSRT
ncbi:hypothetical protein [Mycobacterium sp. DL440]|uniref:hypothetical protein n=1 Tax=Mycobacterium sp. DL440 TaxID=2675523 RepID=UPI001AAE2028|nr:hypothetical protein [Mycobacterium sp. DL440]